MTETLSTAFVLMATLALGAWHSPKVLIWLEAKIRARRIGIKIQKETFLRHMEKLESENV